MRSLPDAATKDDCLIRNPRPFIGEGAPPYGHTLLDDEVKEGDQKVLKGSGTIWEEGLEMWGEGATCHIFKLILHWV